MKTSPLILAVLGCCVMPGCTMPAAVPMPRTQASMQAELRESEPYRRQFMFILGKTSALEQQEDRMMKNLVDQGEADPEGAKEKFPRVARQIANERQVVVDDLRKLKPPAKYEKFHDLYTQVQQKGCDSLKLIAEAFERDDQERCRELWMDYEDFLREAQTSIKAEAKKAGATNLQEYLGF
jgi:polyhydroxyalkanoate synthesis regulator phasin